MIHTVVWVVTSCSHVSDHTPFTFWTQVNQVVKVKGDMEVWVKGTD